MRQPVPISNETGGTRRYHAAYWDARPLARDDRAGCSRGRDWSLAGPGRTVSDPLSEGWAAYERGDWETAASLARAASRLKADDADALRLLARASVRLGRDDSARTLFHRLGRQAMLADDLCLLGISLTRTGDRQGALQVWEQARSSDPNHAETLFELTRAYFAVDRPIAAAETGRRLAAVSGLGSPGRITAGCNPVGAQRSSRRRRILATRSRTHDGRAGEATPRRRFREKTLPAHCCKPASRLKPGTSCRVSWPKGPIAKASGS